VNNSNQIPNTNNQINFNNQAPITKQLGILVVAVLFGYCSLVIGDYL